MTPDCVFCDIINDRAPATYVHRWPDATAFVPLDPVTDGHVLVVPNQHVRDAVEDPAVTAAAMRRAAELAARYEASNILTSVGRPATQSVFHLHIHVIARAVGDQLMVPWGTTGDPHAPHWCGVAEGLDERMRRVRDHAERIRRDLAHVDEAANPDHVWYGYVSLDDVRALVTAALDQREGA